MTRRKSIVPASSAPSAQVQMLEKFIKAEGLRHTRERVSVLESALVMPGRFTVDDLTEAMQRSSLAVSRATVANTLRLLERAGLVMTVGLQGRFRLYQKAPKSGSRQVQRRIPVGISVQCTACGAIKEVRDRAATAALASRRYGAFVPSAGVVTIYGLCSKCDSKTFPNKSRQ